MKARIDIGPVIYAIIYHIYGELCVVSTSMLDGVMCIHFMEARITTQAEIYSQIINGNPVLLELETGDNNGEKERLLFISERGE